MSEKEGSFAVAPPNIPASCKPTAATALNRELDDHVSSVDKRLAAVSEVSNLGYTVTVLDDDIVNAFVLPGETVHISRDLIAIAESETEIAEVPAHEIGHVAVGYSAERHGPARRPRTR